MQRKCDLDKMPTHRIIDGVVALLQLFLCILKGLFDLPAGWVMCIYESCNAKDEFEGVYYCRGFSVCSWKSTISFEYSHRKTDTHPATLQWPGEPLKT